MVSHLSVLASGDNHDLPGDAMDGARLSLLGHLAFKVRAARKAGRAPGKAARAESLIVVCAGRERLQVGRGRGVNLWAAVGAAPGARAANCVRKAV